VARGSGIGFFSVCSNRSMEIALANEGAVTVVLEGPAQRLHSWAVGAAQHTCSAATPTCSCDAGQPPTMRGSLELRNLTIRQGETLSALGVDLLRFGLPIGLAASGNCAARTLGLAAKRCLSDTFPNGVD
jgi:hypothetical protein